jgi:hypothetical protein
MAAGHAYDSAAHSQRADASIGCGPVVLDGLATRSRQGLTLGPQHISKPVRDNNVIAAIPISLAMVVETMGVQTTH